MEVEMDRTRRLAARAILAASVVASVLVATGIAGAQASPDVVLPAHLRVTPSSGPAGTMVVLKGKGFFPDALVTLWFTDAHGTIDLGVAQTGPGGSFKERYRIPGYALPGDDMISGEARSQHNSAWGSTTFTVTGLTAVGGSTRGSSGADQAPASTRV
jgi:hypothetical protein